MAQLGRIERTVLDSKGNPISGATVTVRDQGAFVTSTQAGPVYTVNDPGGIIVGDQVTFNTTTTFSRNVSAVSGSTVTTAGPGLGTLNNNDRITVSSALPTLYADANSVETKANPLVTDANGYCFAWAPIAPYDILTQASGFGTRLETDIPPLGHEWLVSNLFGGGGTVAFRQGTSRTITGGDLWLLENPFNVTKAHIDYAGNAYFTGSLSVTGTSTLTGNVSVLGNLSVTGTTTLTGALSGGAATFSSAFTYSGASGSFSLTAGSIETADLAANAASKTYIGDGTADQAITAAAYNTANYVDITGATITFTPFSSASEITVMAVSIGQPAGAFVANFYSVIKDGSGNIVYEGGCVTSATTGAPVSIPLLHRVTGLSGSTTFKVAVQCVTANMNVNNSTNAATHRVTRIVVIDSKK